MNRINKKSIIERNFVLVALKYFISTWITKKTRYSFLQSTFKQKIIYYNNMQDAGWLFQMVSLLWAWDYKLHGILIFFYQIFVCQVSSKESIIFISFDNKIWRYHDVTTALWQNQIIVIVYSRFFRCLNKVLYLVNEEFYPQQKLMSFEKKNIKNRYFLYYIFPLLL